MKLSMFVLAVFALAGCGASRAAAPASTTVTAAEVAPEPAAPREFSPPAKKDPAPEGQLVCRTQSRDDGTTELYLTWKDDKASGTLRHIAPSGFTEDQPVRAERNKSAIIVDEPNAEDLVDHAAVVGNANGKRMMRVTGSPAEACE